MKAPSLALKAWNRRASPPAREEAPGVYGKGDVRLSVGDRVRIHTGEEGVIHQFLTGQTKCVNVLFRPGHGGSFFGFECEKMEAPAEGAGEREEIARIIDPAAFLFTQDELMKGDPSQFNALSKADRIIAALRNRTSEPEA